MIVAGRTGFGDILADTQAYVDMAIGSQEGYGAQSGGPSSSGMPEDPSMTGESREVDEGTPVDADVEEEGLGDKLAKVPWYVWAGGAVLAVGTTAFLIGSKRG